MELVRLKVVTAFGSYRVGNVIERIPSVAKTMLLMRWYGRKLVEELPTQIAAPIETPVVAQESPPIENDPEPQPIQAEPTRFKPKYKKRG